MFDCLGGSCGPKEVHGGHHTTLGGTGDVQGMVGGHGGHGMAPKGRERPISRYLLTYCQRPSFLSKYTPPKFFGASGGVPRPVEWDRPVGFGVTAVQYVPR